jgi:hypothetical protein
VQVEIDERGSTMHREESCDVASQPHSKINHCHVFAHNMFEHCFYMWVLVCLDINEIHVNKFGRCYVSIT